MRGSCDCVESKEDGFLKLMWGQLAMGTQAWADRMLRLVMMIEINVCRK